MASVKEIIRTKAADREQAPEQALEVPTRIIEKENVMTQDPRMGTAPQTISQSLQPVFLLTPW